MSAVVNIAAYKFAHLTDLKPLRARLLEECRSLNLKGTILLSPEGINLFIAGADTSVEAILSTLRAIPGLADLTPKYSESTEQPFRRMLVRLKKEIIAFGQEGIDPAARTSPKLAPRELKQWLDEGRPVTLLDTRNDYEVQLGTFEGALPAGIDHFRHFPDAVRRLPAELKEQPIVMFCTGGIRCEKAGPFMEREGFRHIYQLEGGILKYFEECGGAHYRGECFVFDQRVGVDPALHETGSAQCFACQAPLSPEDQEDPRYEASRFCPHCYRTPEQLMADAIAEREARIRQIASPLPGAAGYENRRPVSVPAACDGWSALDFLCEALSQIPREAWLAALNAGELLDADGHPAAADRPMRAGERLWRVSPSTVEPDVDASIRLLYEDDFIVVVNKPAPLPIHPSGRYNRNTLRHILNEAYSPGKVRPAHRLDANTTGAVVLSRTHRVASLLNPLFARGAVEKVYLARVNGTAPGARFECTAPISDAPGPLGSRDAPSEGGLPAQTEFEVLESLPDGSTLLAVFPRTGRTNQIRVHLWHMGLPICGDPAYLPAGQLGESMTLALGAPPLCLHAWKLSFPHPVTGEQLHFMAPPPAWAAALKEQNA